MEKIKTILIHYKYKDLEDYTDYSVHEGEALLDTFGGVSLDRLVFNIREINPATYLSKGQIDKTLALIEELDPDFIFWNHIISRRHQRELEKIFKKPIFDRARLILDIFRARAKSSEEKLQVELAYKEYERSRIVGAWSHLERQRGSMSKVGGPGEKQIELDRRMIENKIKVYKRKLKDVYKTRRNQRKARSSVPIIALVGYTNVGKTTLFNLMTKSNDLAENKLFATLGTHVKRMFIEEGSPPKYALLSDTVGFIRNFPTSLQNAFAATLEELKYATLILHVRDLQMPFEDRYAQNILNTIQKIGVTAPIWNVWNKADLLVQTQTKSEQKAVDESMNIILDGEAGTPIQSPPEPAGTFISAKTGQGIFELLEKIKFFLNQDKAQQELVQSESEDDLAQDRPEGGMLDDLDTL